MITERLQQIIEKMKDLSPVEQDRIAAALQRLLEQPSVTSDIVRPEVMAAFDEVAQGSTAVLDYLRDK